MYFSLMTVTDKQIETLEELFTELPVLVDQATQKPKSLGTFV